MIMLPISVRPLEFGLFVSKLMADDQVAVYKKLQSIINGGPAYGDTFVLHSDVKLICIEMIIILIHGFKNG